MDGWLCGLTPTALAVCLSDVSNCRSSQISGESVCNVSEPANRDPKSNQGEAINARVPMEPNRIHSMAASLLWRAFGSACAATILGVLSRLGSYRFHCTGFGFVSFRSVSFRSIGSVGSIPLGSVGSSSRRKVESELPEWIRAEPSREDRIVSALHLLAAASVAPDVGPLLALADGRANPAASKWLRLTSSVCATVSCHAHFRRSPRGPTRRRRQTEADSSARNYCYYHRCWF